MGCKNVTSHELIIKAVRCVELRHWASKQTSGNCQDGQQQYRKRWFLGYEFLFLPSASRDWVSNFYETEHLG